MEDFKVGDKVIINDLNKWNQDVPPGIASGMYKYIDTIQTISDIKSNGGDKIYILKDNAYLWNALWLSPLKFDKELWN